MAISPMRMSGLATGMDTETIIKQLMTAHSAPLNKLNAKKQVTAWQQESYRTVNAKLYEFRNNTIFNFKLEGNLKARTASVSGYSEALSAKVTGDAQFSTLMVRVDQLASSASRVSADFANHPAFDASKALEDQAANLHNSASGEVSFKINGTTINVNTATESLNDVIKKINEQTNVTAFYSAGKLSLIAKNTGKVNGETKDQAEISIEGSFLTDTLKLSGTGSASTGAQNAVATVNGLAVEEKTNKISVNGVELTLNKVTGANSETLIQVNTDVDKIVDSIKSFISSYNDILKTLTDLTQERKYRDFTPLTSEQKEAMKDKEIEQWESKAKSGLLRSDSVLLQAIGNMRLNMQGAVETGNTKYMTLSSLGISSGEYFENGKMYLKDESELREAIAADPDAVVAMFTANGNGDSNRNDVGIAERLYEDINKTITKLTDKAGLSSGLKDASLLGKQLDRIDNEIYAWNARLATIENRYFMQFTRMETVINQYNAQSASLAGMFSGQS
jgi:flagellar hook-associated protein 2